MKNIKIIKTVEPARANETPQPPIHPYTIGSNYFIRTVTHHYTGKLIAVYPQELVLSDAAWIADDGRFNTTIQTGNFNEVEPYPDNYQVVISRSAILDATAVDWKLPRNAK